jgi:hypothetical protein
MALQRLATRTLTATAPRALKRLKHNLRPRGIEPKHTVGIIFCERIHRGADDASRSIHAGATMLRPRRTAQTAEPVCIALNARFTS